MTYRDFDPDQVERLVAIVGVVLAATFSAALPLLASAL
jgi:hypothetical protein